jgi:molecular chaperone DnaK
MRSSNTFESHLDELRGKNFLILWRQDWFVIDRFKMLAEAAHLYPDCQEHAQLVTAGIEALKASDMEKVRHIVAQLDSARIGTAADDDMVAPTNIVLG